MIGYKRVTVPIGRGVVTGVAAAILVLVLGYAGFQSWQFVFSSEQSASGVGGGVGWGSASLPEPHFAAMPHEEAGVDWSTRTLVTNLDELELVVAVKDSRVTGGGIALLDVNSGEMVAEATFSGDILVRLRNIPRQLIVSDAVRGGGPISHRVLAFGILADRIVLETEAPLADRMSYPWFFNAMHVTADEAYLIVPLRSKAAIPECQVRNYIGNVCDRFRVEALDLNNGLAVAASWPMPDCMSVSVHSPLANDVLIRCGNTIYHAGIEAPDATKLGTYESAVVPFIPGQGDTLGIAYETLLSDGSVRVLRGDGVMFRGPEEPQGEGLFATGYKVNSVARVDASRALLVAGPRIMAGPLEEGEPRAREVMLVNLESAEVERRFAVPADTFQLVMVDARRAVAVSSTGLLQLDLLGELVFGTVPAGSFADHDLDAIVR